MFDMLQKIGKWGQKKDPEKNITLKLGSFLISNYSVLRPDKTEKNRIGKKGRRKREPWFTARGECWKKENLWYAAGREGGKKENVWYAAGYNQKTVACGAKVLVMENKKPEKKDFFQQGCFWISNVLMHDEKRDTVWYIIVWKIIHMTSFLTEESALIVFI